MKKSQARLYAESCTEQNKEHLVDALRELLADDPAFYQTLNRLLQMDNSDASRVVRRMSKPDQQVVLNWLIPCARLGLSIATFAMEDKYTKPEEEDNA